MTHTNASTTDGGDAVREARIGSDTSGGTKDSEARTLLIGYYASAADAARVDTEKILTSACTVGELAVVLSERHGEPLASIIATSKFLLGEDVVRGPATPINGHVKIDILPPFAGG